MLYYNKKYNINVLFCVLWVINAILQQKIQLLMLYYYLVLVTVSTPTSRHFILFTLSWMLWAFLFAARDGCCLRNSLQASIDGVAPICMWKANLSCSSPNSPSENFPPVSSFVFFTGVCCKKVRNKVYILYSTRTLLSSSLFLQPNSPLHTPRPGIASFRQQAHQRRQQWPRRKWTVLHYPRTAYLRFCVHRKERFDCNTLH